MRFRASSRSSATCWAVWTPESLEPGMRREMNASDTNGERREFFRVEIPARVRLRAVSGDEVESARTRIRTRQVPAAFAPGALEENRIGSEHRLTIGLLRGIALSLERMERSLAELAERGVGSSGLPEGRRDPVPLSLSGSGFSGPLAFELVPGSVAEVEIDLLDAGYPLIRALAEQTRGPDIESDPAFAAFRFVEIPDDDRERIVQLALRIDRQSLQRNRSGAFE